VAKAFKRKGGEYAGRLDAAERALVVGLLEQVLQLVDPEGATRDTGDVFDDIVAGIGGVGMGISLSAEDRGEATGESGTQAGHPAYGMEDRDPAIDRLFPPGHHGDEAAAAEFRRLTERSLRTRKAHNLTASIEALGAAHGDRVRLDHEQALAFVVALTDVRLVLGERLGLKDDADADRLEALAATLDPDEPLVYALAVYDFLTWLQETLAHALMPS
jgi:hypothetical protein